MIFTMKVNLPHNIKAEINNQMKDVSLSPIGITKFLFKLKIFLTSKFVITVIIKVVSV